MFESVRNFFERGYNSVVGAFHEAGEYLVSGFKSIAEAPKHIVQTVYTDAKKFIKGTELHF